MSRYQRYNSGDIHEIYSGPETPDIRQTLWACSDDETHHVLQNWDGGRLNRTAKTWPRVLPGLFPELLHRGTLSGVSQDLI